MNHERILEYFAARVLGLGFSGVGKNDLLLPNVRWERNDRDLWFELTIGEGEPLNHADEADRRLVTVNVICAVTPGSGTQRLHNVAETVSRMFSPLDARRAGFTLHGNVFTVRGVTKHPVFAANDGVKINVRFILDKYTKEERYGN
jgi:hypothetical protein